MKSFLLFLVFCIQITAVHAQAKQYVCPPCQHSCDREVFTAPGTCPSCHMKLISKESSLFENLTPEEFCQRMAANPNALILDVRSEAEFKGRAMGASYGHFKGAKNTNITDMPRRIGELNAYKNEEVLVYCSHSIRSPQVCAMLRENGFTKVANMSGGVSTITKMNACLQGRFVKH